MKVGYEREFLRYLQSLLAEVERRIRRGHARLALSQTQQSSGVSIKMINNHFAFFNSHFFTSLKWNYVTFNTVHIDFPEAIA